ncbi:MAG: hypothetical protein ACI8W8_002514 [Rhodothermales bacterium]|jgi:hypothetical protein
MSLATFWTNHTLRDGESARVYLGPLTAWIRHVKDEWQVATEYSDDRSRCEFTMNPELPAGLEWQRWISGVTRRLRLVPVMPDRPVIVRPANRFAISPGASGVFYSRIPVWLRLLVGEKEIPLTEIPSVLLSNSWFGAPHDGDPCYSLRTTARREFDTCDLQPFRARCAVHVYNRSETDELNIENLCLRVRSLAVYEVKDGLHTNDIRVDYQGENELPDVEHQNAPPVAKAKLLCEPRDISARELLKRKLNTFVGFRSSS